MQRISTIELFKEDMKFSAGHFTIFSPTVRENLHGHNYNVYASFKTSIGDEGLSFDYRHYKERIYDICATLDEATIIPGNSKYLSIEEKENYFHIMFNHEEMIFLKRDIKILPLTNVTVEELSNYILNQLITNANELTENKISEITVKVFSGPGQSGSASWSLAHD